MTNDEIRIACAEEMGIKPSPTKEIEDGRSILRYLEDGKWLKDYPNSLDACKELLKFAVSNGVTEIMLNCYPLNKGHSWRCLLKFENNTFCEYESIPELAIMKAFLKWRGRL